MTPTGRAVLAVTALVVGAFLIALGALSAHGDASSTAGVSVLTLVIGYVFGDRNGEKRLASALVVANAGTTVDPASDVAAAIAAPAAAKVRKARKAAKAKKRKAATA